MGKEELSTKMELDAARFGEQVEGRLETGEEQAGVSKSSKNGVFFIKALISS